MNFFKLISPASVKYFYIMKKKKSINRFALNTLEGWPVGLWTLPFVHVPLFISLLSVAISLVAENWDRTESGTWEKFSCYMWPQKAWPPSKKADPRKHLAWDGPSPKKGKASKQATVMRTHSDTEHMLFRLLKPFRPTCCAHRASYFCLEEIEACLWPPALVVCNRVPKVVVFVPLRNPVDGSVLGQSSLSVISVFKALRYNMALTANPLTLQPIYESMWLW